MHSFDEVYDRELQQSNSIEQAVEAVKILAKSNYDHESPLKSSDILKGVSKRFETIDDSHSKSPNIPS